VLVAVAYVVAVHFLVVRTGALSWSQMSGMSGAVTLQRLLYDIGFAALITLPVVFGALIFGSLIGLLLQVEAPQQVPLARTSVEALAVALGAAVVAPVGEELFFRGFALSAWQRDLGVRAALIRSSVFFAIVHIANVDALTFGEGVRQALLSLAVIAPIGFLLGWLFQQRGIVASIAGHVTYNATLILLLFLVTQALGSPPA
jgi:membrane protease YdiL (CAAX protease family)